MNEQEALSKMIAPGTKRPGKYRSGVIQIWVTRACDKSCFNCTQGSNLGGNPGMITLEQFEQAVISLKGYYGVVGVFGGNPALHPKFPELCEILKKHIPYEHRGLWCNHPKGHGKVMQATFNPSVSNLNVHLDMDAYLEFMQDWPGARVIGLRQDSRHSPCYVAMKDIIPTEEERWELISNCDINKHWSAMVGVFRGEVRAWFCEIAGAQAMLHQHEPEYPDTGVEVNNDRPYTIFQDGDASNDLHFSHWWQMPMFAFRNQVRKHCHECSVPLKGYGELAQKHTNHGTEQVSTTHQNIYKPKDRTRRVELVVVRKQVKEGILPKMTDYLGNSRR